MKFHCARPARCRRKLKAEDSWTDVLFRAWIVAVLLFLVILVGVGAAAQGKQSSQIERSIEALADADPDVRQRAALVLAEIGPAAAPAVPALVKALADPGACSIPTSLRRRPCSTAGPVGGALYGLPMGRRSIHLHVWNNLLERAGFTLADIPKEWEAFWFYWCDRVQPAVRKALGRDDVWGIGLPMSASGDTDDDLMQFQLAYGTPWLDSERRSRIDDPKIRAGIVKALEAYTAVWRKGCTPLDSVSWTNIDNNKAFLAQTVVMTPNTSLSIPGALRTARRVRSIRQATPWMPAELHPLLWCVQLSPHRCRSPVRPSAHHRRRLIQSQALRQV